MDFNYFLNEETGRFKIKRLPTTKSVIRVKDVTDLSDYRSDFKYLTFDEGVNHYRALFRESYSYDVEVDDFETAFNRLSAKALGQLAPFAKEYELLANAYYEVTLEDYDFNDGIVLDNALEKKALKAGLVEKQYPVNVTEWGYLLGQMKMIELRELAKSVGIETKKVRKDDLAHLLAMEGDSGNAKVPKPAWSEVKLTALCLDLFYQWHVNAVNQLKDELESYLLVYKQVVWDEVEHLVSGDTIPNLKNNWKFE